MLFFDNNNNNYIEIQRYLYTTDKEYYAKILSLYTNSNKYEKEQTTNTIKKILTK